MLLIIMIKPLATNGFGLDLELPNKTGVNQKFFVSGQWYCKLQSFRWKSKVNFYNTSNSPHWTSYNSGRWQLSIFDSDILDTFAKLKAMGKKPTLNWNDGNALSVSKFNVWWRCWLCKGIKGFYFSGKEVVWRSKVISLFVFFSNWMINAK